MKETMENIFYKQMIIDDYDAASLTFGDFIEICDKLALPVFEIENVINPFAEPHNATNYRTYNNMTEYRKSMPDWSARLYDYENDKVLGYYPMQDISSGSFIFTDANNHSSFKWGFLVLAGVVVVHKIWNITD